MAFGQFNQAVSGTRPLAAGYDHGVWVETRAKKLTLLASVQPASQDQLLLVPEGRRIEGVYALRAFTEIRLGDRYSIYGQPYEVLHAQRWMNGVLGHWLGIATRELKTDG